MSDTVDTFEVNDTQEIVVTEQQYTLPLPTVTLTTLDADSVAAFEEQLKVGLEAEVLGTIGTQKAWGKFLMHNILAEKYWTVVQRTVNRINGIRTPEQRVGDKKRSLRATAQAFYEALSTPMLRKQCALFNIDYDSYKSQEDIIAALVEQHVQMVDAA